MREGFPSKGVLVRRRARQLVCKPWSEAACKLPCFPETGTLQISPECFIYLAENNKTSAFFCLQLLG